MKGKISKTEDCGWIVTSTFYNSMNQPVDDYLQLHPDDVESILSLSNIVENLEDLILSSTEVSFEIVENQKLSGVARYAKITGDV